MGIADHAKKAENSSILAKQIVAEVLVADLVKTTEGEEDVAGPNSVVGRSPVSIHGNSINHVTSFKYLGVHIDSDFSWHTQVEKVCTRVHQRLHFLR